MRSVAHPEWALVLGGGECVWEDVLAWEAIYGRMWDGIVIAANDIGCHWPRELDHWVSLHPNKFPKWKDLRAQQDLPMDGILTWGTSRHARVTDRQVNPWGGGSSGMMATQVAWVSGCTRAILCGIPMTPTAHFSESREGYGSKEWRAAAGHWRAWGTTKHRMEGWVKSMSGRTRELLGDPTVEWLVAGGPLNSPVE